MLQDRMIRNMLQGFFQEIARHSRDHEQSEYQQQQQQMLQVQTIRNMSQSFFSTLEAFYVDTIGGIPAFS